MAKNIYIDGKVRGKKKDNAYLCYVLGVSEWIKEIWDERWEWMD